MRGKPLYIATGICLISACLVFLAIASDGRSVRIEHPFTKDAALKIITQNDTLFFDVELADNHDKRTQGLMFRYSMEANQGMFFIFDFSDIQSFWMRNTFISLDMLFINEDFEIIQIHENAFPLSEEPILSNYPAKYVLEILGGVSMRKGIRVGDVVRLIIDCTVYF